MTSSLGQTIRTAREQRGLTRAELARRCGISLRHLASIETGANFSVAVLFAITAELPEVLDQARAAGPRPVKPPGRSIRSKRKP